MAKKILGIAFIILGAYLVYFYMTHQEQTYYKGKAKPTCLYVGIPAILMGAHMARGGKFPGLQHVDQIPDKYLPLLFGLPGYFMMKNRQKIGAMKQEVHGREENSAVHQESRESVLPENLPDIAEGPGKAVGKKLVCIRDGHSEFHQV